jgi:hypothetical protein
METKLIPGSTPLPEDKTVLAAIARQHDADAAGKPMSIGLLGPDGAIYRTIRTSGFREYMGVCDALGELGFVHVASAKALAVDDLFRMPGTPVAPNARVVVRDSSVEITPVVRPMPS